MEERLKPCVVFNKFDRLIVELGYDSRDAYERVRMLLHEVNGLMSAFESEKFISRTDVLLTRSTPPRPRADERTRKRRRTARRRRWITWTTSKTMMMKMRRRLTSREGTSPSEAPSTGGRFDPTSPTLYAEKLGCSKSSLFRALSGDWYYHPKMRRIVSRKVAKGKLKPSSCSAY